MCRIIIESTICVQTVSRCLFVEAEYRNNAGITERKEYMRMILLVIVIPFNHESRILQVLEE